MVRWILALIVLPFSLFAFDVVIPCHKKDKDMLKMCIQSIHDYVEGAGNIYVISDQPYTDKAMWIDEAIFPFSKGDIADLIGVAHDFSRLGWYYQQLLKLYLFSSVEGLSDKVLVVDADVVYLNPTQYLSNDEKIQLNVGRQYIKSYFDHAEKLIPGFYRNQSLALHDSGIADCMLFDKEIIDDIFKKVERHHHKPLWEAFMLCVEPIDYNRSGASEFEMIFNHALNEFPNKVKINRLKTRWGTRLNQIAEYKHKGYHYISFHSWNRKFNRNQ